jgi:endoglucanase
VNDAGFNTVRIPCAWDSHIVNNQIDPAWLARVKEVIDYCYNNEMYVIINIHWDGGWLENNPTYAQQNAVNAKQEAYWLQIANYFADYDEHLLFAGANEVNIDWAKPTTENLEVLESYLQTFVDAVRSTGGKNTYRTLIVQSYSCSGEYAQSMNLPSDPTSERLMAEVHSYEPYQFGQMTEDADWGNMFYFWGADYHQYDTTGGTRTATWGEEDYMDSYYHDLKTKFVDSGVPVILGEYGAIHRANLGDIQSNYEASRAFYYEYVTKAAKDNGVVPVVWDNGYNGENGFAIFDRNNGSVLDSAVLDGIMKGAAAGQYPF